MKINEKRKNEKKKIIENISGRDTRDPSTARYAGSSTYVCANVTMFAQMPLCNIFI